jgi:4-amino-4-deoxy-L-arabinose transferase-like glycosyltransferase
VSSGLRMLSRAEAAATLPAATLLQRLKLHSPYAGLCAIAVFALLLRLGSIVPLGGTGRWMDPNTDSLGYVALANGIRHGCGFAPMDKGKCLAPEVNRTPGYPLFLAALPSIESALIAQATLAAAVVFVIGVFVSRRWGSGAALVTSLVAAVDVPSIVYGSEVMTETLFMAAFTFAVLAELSAMHPRCGDTKRLGFLGLASLLFGYAIFVRPIGLVAVPAAAMIPLLAMRAGWLKRIAFFVTVVAVSLVVVAGWSLRNRALTGTAAFSTIGSRNFFYYRAGGTLAYAQGIGWEAELHKLNVPAFANLNGSALRIIMAHPMASEMTAWSLLYLCVVPDRGPLSHLLGVQRSFLVEDPGSMRVKSALERMGEAPGAAIRSIFRAEFDSSMTLALLITFQLATAAFLWTGVALALRHWGRGAYEDTCLVSLAGSAFVLLIIASGP